jgi:hypothetical protein
MIFKSIVLSLVFMCFLALAVSAQIPDSLRFTDSWGFRIGATADPGVSGAKPTLDAYYEVPFGNILVSGDLQFLFVSPEAIGIHLFTGAGDPVLESYGFHGILRGIFSSQTNWRPFIGAGFGFDVYALYQNRIAASTPVLAGELVTIGSGTELELAARITPLFFFNMNPGVSFGATVGIRFSN